MQIFTVYILFSATLEKYYIGYTGQSIQQRLNSHLANHKGFTAKVKDWKVVYTRNFDNKKAAMNEEKRLKALKSKIRLQQLIEMSSSPASYRNE